MTAADTLAVARDADVADDTLAVQTIGLTKRFATIAVVTDCGKGETPLATTP